MKRYRPPHLRSSPRRHAGFSLIELMIAVVLGVIVVAGLINVLIANKQAYGLQQARNYNQENMRFALDRIGWSVRMADFWGGTKSASITGMATGGSGCNTAWAETVSEGVYGYDGAAAFPISSCVNNANYVTGSDVLVVRYALPDAAGVATGGSVANVPVTAGKLYLQVKTGGSGDLFVGSTPVDLSSDPVGTSIYPYAVDMYYLRPCSVPDGAGGTCTATSDGGHPIPTLMDMHLDDSGNLVSDPIVEGVEQLQFEYGLGDPPGDPTPTVYKNAASMTAADWSNVVSVRVGYVLRSQSRDTAVPHSFDSGSTNPANATYVTRLSSDCEYSVSTSGAVTVASGCTGFNTATATGTNPQQFVRTEMSAIAQVRNRVRG
jgi:type IV pilus assembly protein PilW